MNNADARLRSVVFGEIERLERTKDQSQMNQPNRLLGAFVDAALSNARRTRAQLAQSLRMDVELLDAVLDGDEVDDQILADIAQALDYEPNVLRLLMGRSIEPTRSARQSR